MDLPFLLIRECFTNKEQKRRCGQPNYHDCRLIFDDGRCSHQRYASDYGNALLEFFSHDFVWLKVRHDDGLFGEIRTKRVILRDTSISDFRLYSRCSSGTILRAGTFNFGSHLSVKSLCRAIKKGVALSSFANRHHQQAESGQRATPYKRFNYVLW